MVEGRRRRRYGGMGERGMEIVESLGAISCWNTLMQELANQMSEMSGTPGGYIMMQLL